MDIDLLVKLTARAWSLNILALLHDGTPGRQAPLLAATGAGRTSFTASMEHLIRLGFLERNPGHGHPLRPEYRLTEMGEEAARIASGIVHAVPDPNSFALLQRSWSVPVLALSRQPQRFSGLRSGLDTVTDRALSLSLRQLEEQDWLKRDIDTSGRMPFPTYCAINQGLAISKAVNLRV